MLYDLVLSICGMITRLESQVNTGLNLTLQDLLTRRSVDFLVITLLNFRNLVPSLSLYWVLYLKVREVSLGSTVEHTSQQVQLLSLQWLGVIVVVNPRLTDKKGIPRTITQHIGHNISSLQSLYREGQFVLKCMGNSTT